jgi:hypothetical protein
VEQNKLERLSLASIFKLIKILIARLKIIVLGAPLALLTNITDFAKMVSKHKRTSLFSQSVDVREKGFVPLTLDVFRCYLH